MMKGKICFIVTLCIFLTGLVYGCVEEEEGNEAPTSNLSVNPTSGESPLTVTFTLTASDNDGNISLWELDIDNDGSPDYSGTGNPPFTRVHTYANQGYYTAQLTVTDNEGKTGTDAITIIVNESSTENQSPTCTLLVTPSSGYAPLGVTFSMDAHDPGGTIVSWSLDIDNDGIADYSGTGSLLSTKAHTYFSTGTYTATLTVIDNQGASNTDTVTLSVTEIPSENQSPTCLLTVNPSSGSVPLSVSFIMTASDPDGTISTWILDIDNDGIPEYSGSGTPPSTTQHIYQTAGTYTATLTVTDNQGKTDSDTEVITINQASLLTADCYGPYSGLTGSSISFKGGATGGVSPYSYAWDFNNDGTYESTLQNPTHTYSTAQTYTVKLLVTDSTSATDACVTTAIITTGGVGTPTISINPVSSTVGQGNDFCIEVHINSGGQPLQTAGFQLSYPTSFTLKSFTYENLLNTNVLEVGKPSVGDTSGFINYAVSRTDGNAEPENGKLATIYFMAPGSPGGPYDLDLHDIILVDGTGNTIKDIGITYGTVTVTDGSVPPQNQVPTCLLTVNQTSGTIPLTVSFVMTASDPDGTISTWILDIDNDGIPEYSGSGTPPSTTQHIYQTAGTYTAKFTVTDNHGATVSYSRILTITETPSENHLPTCTLAAAPLSGIAPLAVTFTLSASDSDGSIFTWSLDINNDGTSDYAGSGTPPTTQQHIYQEMGTYIVDLTVTDNQGALSSDTLVITVSQYS